MAGYGRGDEYVRVQDDYQNYSRGTYDDGAPSPSPTRSQYPPQHGNDSGYLPADGMSEKYGESAGLAGAGVAGAAAGYGGASALRRSGSNPFASNKRSKSRLPLIVGIIVAVILIAGIVIGIAVWRVKANQNSSSSSSSTSGSTNGTSSTTNTNTTTQNGATLRAIPGTSGAVLSDPTDPSNFEKNPAFHQSFWGMAYTPFNALEPWCGATLANVTQDIQILSQLTTRIRMYGSACNQSALVLQAIADTKVDMTVWLGVYINDNETTNADQMQTTLNVLRTYGATHVSGVTVGNEYILNAADQTTAVNFIVSKMAEFRTALTALNLGKAIPVGTADAGSMITAALNAGAEFIMSNVHPFFGGLPVAQAAAWTWSYWQQTNVAIASPGVNQYIAETGWPSMSSSVENATIGGAVAGIPELQTYLDTYPCQAIANSTATTGSFYFELVDEKWKDDFFGGVEGWWGILDEGRRLKTGLTIPVCP